MFAIVLGLFKEKLYYSSTHISTWILIDRIYI